MGGSSSDGGVASIHCDGTALIRDELNLQVAHHVQITALDQVSSERMRATMGERVASRVIKPPRGN